MELPGSRVRRDIVGLQKGLQRVFDLIEDLQSTLPPTISQATILGAVEPILDPVRDRLAVLDTLPQDFANVLGKMKDLTFAVSEGIERTSRQERRVHATVARARKELKARGYEDPGLESEAYELHSVDGGGGGAGELPPVRDRVETYEEASSVPGVSVDELRRANFKRLRSYG